jgi:mRNA interferase HigB
LREFWEKHPDAEEPLKTWFRYVKTAQWESPSDVKDMFRHADFLQNNRICFNIKGKKYRLIVKVIYELQRVYIRFTGTHSAYDRIDANRI